MKADQYGTPSEQARHEASWRTAAKGEGRCDGCARSELDDKGNGRTTAHCAWLDCATKPNATCEFHSPIPMPPPSVAVLSDILRAGEIDLAWRLMLGRADEPTVTAALAQIDAHQDHERHALLIARLGQILRFKQQQEKTVKEQDDLPTVGEMIEATAPDKALPVLKSTGTDIEAYDARRIIGECRALMSQSAEAMLEAGKRLIELKKHEPHGEFERILTDELRLEPRVARRMMSAAIKFTAPALEAKRTTLSVLGKSKMFELMTEDEEDLAELADGGTLAGKTLDEIDRMSVRELKAALRKEKEDARQREENIKADLEATRKRIAKKDERINELEEKLENKPALPDTAEADKYATDLNIEADAIFARINASLRGRCLAVRDSHHDARAEHGRLLIAQALGRIISGARILAADLDIMPDEDATDAFNHGADGDDGDIWDAVNAAQDQG